MKREFFIGAGIACGILILYTLIYFLSPTKKEEELIESPVSESILQCKKGSIIGVLDNIALCFNESTISLQVENNQQELVTNKLITNASQIAVAEPYVVIILPDKAVLFDYAENKLTQIVEYKLEGTNIINTILRWTDNRLYLLITRELAATSEDSDKTDILILEWNTESKVFSQISHILDRRILTIADLLSKNESLYLLLEEAYSFLERVTLIYKIDPKVGPRVFSQKCADTLSNIPFVGEGFVFLNNNCGDFSKGYLLFTQNEYKEISSDANANFDLFFIFQNQIHIIQRGNSFTFAKGLLTEDPKVWSLKGYSQLSEMQHLGKGSIIGSEKTVDYIDFKYTDQILYRFMIKTQ